MITHTGCVDICILITRLDVLPSQLGPEKSSTRAIIRSARGEPRLKS